MPRLLAIFAGKPRELTEDAQGRPLEAPWRTGFAKQPVDGPILVGRLGLPGDGSRHPHGGEERALLAYAADHYAAWRAELGVPQLGPGGFAENFAIAGLAEGDVCLGDVYQVGEALVEVSEPRAPCTGIPRRWGIPDLLERTKATGRIGWLMRVQREGYVQAGQPFERVARPHPEWTVARAYEVFKARKGADDPAGAAALAALPALSAEWRAVFAKVPQA